VNPRSTPKATVKVIPAATSKTGVTPKLATALRTIAAARRRP
jgi:hypothetical protein